MYILIGSQCYNLISSLVAQVTRLLVRRALACSLTCSPCSPCSWSSPRCPWVSSGWSRWSRWVMRLTAGWLPSNRALYVLLGPNQVWGGRGEFQSSRGHHYHHITAFHPRPILRCLNSWMGGSNVNIWGIWKHHSNQLAIDGVGVIIVCQCFSPSPPKDSLMQQQYCDQEYERAVIFRLGRLIQAREDIYNVSR